MVGLFVFTLLVLCESPNMIYKLTSVTTGC